MGDNTIINTTIFNICLNKLGVDDVEVAENILVICYF